MQSMVNLLEPVAQSGRPIVIIADEVEGEPLTALVVNHMKGALKCCAVKAPSFGDIRKFIMEDIAAMTGGQFISTQLGLRMEDLTPECLGTCAKIKITPVDTTIVSNNDDETKERIRTRVTQLREELENTESSYDKMKLRERIAKLLSGIAVIKVGGATEVEVKERKDRVDDAVQATKAALEEGILPGGGVSLIRFSKEQIGLPDGADNDFVTGVNILRSALSSQLKAIAENSGKSGDVIVTTVANNDNYNYGYNARTDEYCDLVEAGILDATKVVRCAIENGASVAGQLLTVEGLVIDDIDANAKIMSMYQRQPQM
jgi:chaperonin GroEL